jgi:hypothetical protein
MSLPNIEIAGRIVKHLAEIMRITDWDIEIAYCSIGELSRTYGENAAIVRGDCQRDLKNYEAYIRLNEEFEPAGKMGCNYKYWWYRTIVHELHHIVTARYEMYAVEAVSRLESQSLIDNTNAVMLVEYENITAMFAKAFTTVFTLADCLDDLGLTKEALE